MQTHWTRTFAMVLMLMSLPAYATEAQDSCEAERQSILEATRVYPRRVVINPEWYKRPNRAPKYLYLRQVGGHTVSDINAMTCEEILALAERMEVMERDPDRLFAGGRAVFVPGIQTSAEEADATLGPLADTLGLSFMAIENRPSNTVTADVSQAIFEKLNEIDESWFEDGLAGTLTGAELSYFAGPHKQAILDVMTEVYRSLEINNEHISIVAHSEGSMLVKSALVLLDRYVPELDLESNVRVLTMGGAASTEGWPVPRIHHVYDPYDAVANIGPATGFFGKLLRGQLSLDPEHNLSGYVDLLQPEMWSREHSRVQQ